MAKVTENEFFEKLKEVVTDAEQRISIMEDFADSFSEKNEENEQTATIDYESDKNPYKSKFETLLDRYEKRFLGNGKDSVAETIDEVQDDPDRGIKDEDIFVM